MVKIGLISDTHDTLPESLLSALSQVDEIWHLGDVCEPSIVDTLQTVGPPLQGVAGNCDRHRRWGSSLKLHRAGITFLLVHIPIEYPPEGVDVVLHGHTHVPRDEMVNGCRFINPGAAGGSDKGAGHGFSILTLEPGKRLTCDVIPMS